MFKRYSVILLARVTNTWVAYLTRELLQNDWVGKGDLFGGEGGLISWGKGGLFGGKGGPIW